jgi:hypothetical protein
MNYSVDWTDETLSTLAAIWLGSPDRQGVTVAQARIDELLAADPHGNGVPVSEGLYAIEVHPLRAQFELSDADRVVTVVGVGMLP